ncbi:hypothetical protein PFISCL1PPCAC_3536 [Pristionchus fissidentatus]|uniref:Insulin-degrading enzyme n=1 Tax=Pristionchus fissidentatus TaxID=1538716 RepID=A0AAV5V0W3_9BILA|nr:hypothetical protein PFISCL1PPCAC_3536 [Pristionchus fissidentatus]
MLTRSLLFTPQTRNLLYSRVFTVHSSSGSISSVLRPFSSSALMASPVVKRIDDIIKSKVDKREYRGLLLSNGLKVLLVSDAEADKAAAALSVQCGHLNDPWEVPGVAHFCEHMLFLGTEKYPEENEYSKYVTANAGSSNAYTSSDVTNYHFDVKTDALEGALDRFSQFFLSPQFTESATDREVNAVDSEHSNNLGNDAWRFLQIDRNLSKPGHAYGKFGTGNRQTLAIDTKEKGVEPRQVLLDFHKKHYSSNIMALVVAGKNPLDELEAMVCKLGFAEIENMNVTPDVYDHPYGPEQCGKFVQAVPIKDMRTLSMCFPMPDLTEEYKTNPAGYLSHLLGHEGTGSVMSHLKKAGWISSFAAGHRTIANGFGEFKISIDLTLDGLEHTEDIMTEVFQAIALIRAAGPQEWIHEEVKQLRAVEFDFKDKEGPMKLATSSASSLHHIPMKDILSSDYLLDGYRPARIMELSEYLRPSNMWYRVVSKKFEGAPEMEKEPIYGTSFSLSKIPDVSLARFQSAYDCTVAPEYLALPGRNPYIATKLSQKPECGVQGKHPTLVRDDRWSRVWFKQDDEFNRPKALVKLAVTSPYVGLDPMNMATTALTINLFHDSLTEYLYDPELAGLTQAVEVCNSGVDIKVRGFDEKLPLFLHDILEKMIKFKPEADRFAIVKERFIRNLRNFNKSQPYALSQSFMSVLITERVWSKEQLLACAKDITLEQTADAFKHFLTAFHVEMLVHGNMREEEALTMATNTVSQLRSVNPHARALFANEAAQRREMDVGVGNSLVFRHPQDTHEVSCVQTLLQVGKRNRRDNCLLSLLNQIINEPAFNVLRTNESLGYIVATFPNRSTTAQSLCLLVQGKKDPDTVDERIEAFLVNHVRPLLADMSEDEFATNVEACVHALEEKPKTLGQRFARFWAQVDSRMYDFDKYENEIAELKKLSKKDIVDFFESKIAPGAPQRRKLSIYVHGKEDSVAEVMRLRNGGERRRREKREAGDAAETTTPEGEKEVTTVEKTEIVHVDAVRDSLGYFGRPLPALDLPPIGTSSLECSDDNDDLAADCKARL